MKRIALTAIALTAGACAAPTPPAPVVCADRCRDEKQHAFYRGGGGFRWRWPKVDRLRSADPHFGFMLNRYPHNVIGAAFHVGRHGVGVRWKGSR